MCDIVENIMMAEEFMKQGGSPGEDGEVFWQHAS